MTRLCKKLPNATAELKDAEEDFKAINSSADPALVALWAEQERLAQKDRDRDSNSMDIFDIKLHKGQKNRFYAQSMKLK